MTARYGTMEPLILPLILVVHALLVFAPAVSMWFAMSRQAPGKRRWLAMVLALTGPLVAAYLLVVIAWLPFYSGECGGWLGETSPCNGFGQYVTETLYWAAMGLAVPAVVGLGNGVGLLLLRWLFVDRGRASASSLAGGAPSFLVIQSDAFAVLCGAPADPRRMTALAMRHHRGAVCLGRGGEVFTLVEVNPLHVVTLLDRLLPWRKVPARLVGQPGPDMSLEDVRARLLAILQRDSSIADFLAMPADAAIARLERAQSPAELIDAADAITRG